MRKYSSIKRTIHLIFIAVEWLRTAYICHLVYKNYNNILNHSCRRSAAAMRILKPHSLKNYIIYTL